MTSYEFLKLAVIGGVVFSAAVLLLYWLTKHCPVPPEPVYSIRDHFPKVLNDEVVTPIMDDYLMKCCDCGLVHRFRFRAVKVKKRHADGSWSYDVLDPERFRVELSAQRVDGEPGAVPAEALQERYDFVLAACRDAQDVASRYGWALHDIAQGKGDPVAVARAALLGTAGVALPDDAQPKGGA